MPARHASASGQEGCGEGVESGANIDVCTFFLVLITTCRRPLLLEALRFFWSRTSRYAWNTARLLREDIYTLDTFYKLGISFILGLEHALSDETTHARFKQALAAVFKRPLSDLPYRGAAD